jgi:hypothetical protein
MIGNLEQEYLLHAHPAQIERIVARLLPYTRHDYMPTDCLPSALADINKLFLAPEQLALGDADKPTLICLVRFFITSYLLKQQNNYFQVAALDPSQAQLRLDLAQKLHQYQQNYGKTLQQTLPWGLQQQIPCLRSWLDGLQPQAPAPLNREPMNSQASTVGLMTENTRRVYNRASLCGGVCTLPIFLIMGLYLALSTLTRQDDTLAEETGIIITDGLAAIGSVAAGLVNLSAHNRRHPLIVSIIAAGISLVELILCASLAFTGGINNTWLLTVAASFAGTRLLLLTPGIIDNSVGYFQSRHLIPQENRANVEVEIARPEPSPTVALPAQDPTEYTRLFSPEPTNAHELAYPTFALLEDTGQQAQTNTHQQDFSDLTENKREYQPPV